MAVVEIPLELISDRETFHDVFADRLGFFEGYGRNMDAWNDCMSDPQLRSASAKPGEILTLYLTSYQDFKARNPELLSDLIESAAFVNWREVSSGRRPVVSLAFYE